MRQIILFIVLLLLSPLAAAEPIQILSMRIQPSLQSTTITFTLNHRTTGRVKYLPDKKQVWVDFANTKKRFNMQNARLVSANIISITTVNINNGVRFIFAVQDKVKWTTRYTVSADKTVILEVNFTSDHIREPESSAINRINQEAVTLDSAPKVQGGGVKVSDEDIFALLAEHKNNIGRVRLDNQAKAIAAQKQRKFTVAIDAGHGGKDTGALGANGAKEKTVVLGVAKRLAQLINQTPNMRAILTREGDYFVPLRQRMKLARKDEADLFIAIHADAYFEPNARGASVYALSARGATSEAARWLAQKDNYSELDGVELNALQDRSALLRSVLIDMSQTATIQDSLHLGNRVLDALDAISTLHYKHVEQAPFMVLRSPDIPSILIETGFISNPVEEKRLVDPVYQEKLARAILQGLQAYQRS